MKMNFITSLIIYKLFFQNLRKSNHRNCFNWNGETKIFLINSIIKPILLKEKGTLLLLQNDILKDEKRF